MRRYQSILSSLVLVAIAVGWLLATQSRQSVVTALLFGAMALGWGLASAHSGTA